MEEVYLKLYFTKTNSVNLTTYSLSKLVEGLKASFVPTTLVDVKGKTKLKVTFQRVHFDLPTYLFIVSYAMCARKNS